MVQRAGVNAHDRTPRRGRWIRHILVPQDFRAAVLVKSDRFH
jgi:hypothetical protein